MTTFKEYKDKLFLKDIEEIVINKKVNIRGIEVLILSFIKYDNKNKLWTVQKRSTDYKADYDQSPLTNREEYRNRIKSSNQYENIHINQMKIQDNIINFTSSEGTAIEYASGEQINIMKHFIDTNLLSKDWDDIQVDDIIFGIYEQCEEENFPTINYNEKINITLSIDEDIKEVLIEHPLTVSIGEAKKGTKIYYKDVNGEEDFFYLDEVIKYDLHTDTLEKLEKNIDYIDEEFRESYINSTMEDINNICPKNMDVTSIYYETQNNTQLKFYTKDNLEAKPVYSTSSTGVIWFSDESHGINGCYKYVDMLCPVEKDFNGELEIELFSKYNKIPKEEINFEI